MEKVVTKAKRKLTDITFEHEGAHLALVHKMQGGSANGYKTLVMKSVDNRSPEFIQKASQIIEGQVLYSSKSSKNTVIWV